MNICCFKSHNKTRFQFFILFFLSFPQLSKSQIVSNNSIIIGTVDSVESKILNEKRKIWVYVPTRNQPLFAPEKFPVLYLLDGDAHFPSVMGMIQQLSEVNGNSICPNMIIVGITNTNRMRDLTPTIATMGDSAFVRNSGGGENFTDFIEKELIPHIDSNYPTAPYRMLIGHSLGGLMVINTLVHRPQLFTSYIAIDPSLWWGNHKLLDESAEVMLKQHFEGKTLSLTMAHTMPPDFDTAKVRKETSFSPRLDHVKSVLKFSDMLKSNPQNGLRWDWKYYKNDSHGSVPLIAAYDALHFIFDGYQFFLPRPDQANLDSILNGHYKNISKMMGYTIHPPEMMVNGLGHHFLQQKMFEKAFTFFKMNADNYPESFNVHDSMGQYYEAKGDKKKAIEYLTKALELGYFPETKRKLDELKSGK